MGDISSNTNPQTTWSSKRYYEIGLIGSVLGLTNNMYLFTNVRHLGGTFSAPYLLFSLMLGIPLVILELSLSQYGQKDLLQIWELSPVFKGLGYLSLLYLFILQIEGLGVLAFLARYMVSLFSMQTGWDTCTNYWNTEFCYTLETNHSRRLDCYETYGKNTCDTANWESSHNEYWFHVAIYIEFGMFQWKNLLYCLGVATIALALTCKGVKVIEKVVYWFLILAAIEFTILLYCSFIQHGSGTGLSYFFHWDWALFEDKLPWAVCIDHVVISTALGTGVLRTLGSQNKFRGHSYMNGMMIILVDITVTMLYMLLYFSLCGNLSYFSDQPIWQIFESKEPELWSKIPRMIQRLEGPTRFWQWIFYTQIFLILLSKVIVGMFVMIKTTCNWFPRMEQHFMSTVCGLYIAVLICCLPTFTKLGTFYSHQLIGLTVKGPMILAINFLQVTVILYIYGLATVVDDMHFMLGFRWPFHWQVILFFTPVILCATWILYLIYFHETLHDLPDITDLRITLMNLVAYCPFYITAGYAVWYIRMMIWKCKWENVFRPSDSWYLADPILRKSRQMFSAMSMTKEYLYRQTKRQEKAAYDFDNDLYPDND